METEKQLDELNGQLRDLTEKDRQLRRQLMREKNKASYQKRKLNPEYRARTHRLVGLGGMIEHFYPATKEMTTQELYEVIETLYFDPEVRAKTENVIRKVRFRQEIN